MGKKVGKMKKHIDLAVSWGGLVLADMVSFLGEVEIVTILQSIAWTLTIIYTILKIYKFFKNK